MYTLSIIDGFHHFYPEVSGGLFKFYLQHQLEFRVSVIVVPSVLCVFPTPLISVDFSTIRDIGQDPIKILLLAYLLQSEATPTHMNHANTRRPRTTV